MNDRTLPVPAPDGYRWHIRESHATALAYLELIPIDATIDSHGMAWRPGKKLRPVFGPFARINKPRDIRSASRHILRTLERDTLRAELLDLLKSRINHQRKTR